ncbi:MAG: threonine synthase [Parcubacteria group bacterium Athens0416_74]|nr:MAG: threonine synthase [Parcubacteria group bacterium Athens0416_74]
MLYQDTRGGPLVDFPTTLLKGIPENGGLYIPEKWPVFTENQKRRILRMRRYTDVAYAVLAPYVDEETRRVLKRLLKRAYTRKKFGSAIVPVKKLDQELFLLKVSQGPTWAFKDMALQLLGELLDFWLEKKDRYLNIIVATSGDTGSAAIEALRGKKRISIIVLSPSQGNMSEAQMRQMYGVHDKKVFNIIIEGDFDDAQDILKAIMRDDAFKNEYMLGLVNSINWSRIIAQTAYFVWAWSRIAKGPDDPIIFSVPSGNFGDAHGAFGAKMMGIPIEHIIVATNENDVLDRFFKTGRYDARVNEPLAMTDSPSMNIKVASNFERLLAEAFRRNGKMVAHLMSHMGAGANGWFDISALPEFGYFAKMGFLSDSCSDAQTREAINVAYGRYGVVIDPHTAVALRAAWKYPKVGTPIAIVETALWEKFPATIKESLGFMPPLSSKYRTLMRRKKRFVRMEADVEAVKGFIAEKFKKAA